VDLQQIECRLLVKDADSPRRLPRSQRENLAIVARTLACPVLLKKRAEEES
jgi:hypothetical protein